MQNMNKASSSLSSTSMVHIYPQCEVLYTVHLRIDIMKFNKHGDIDKIKAELRRKKSEKTKRK